MADWIVELIEQHGYLAVVLLMVAENVFPPIPSELIMPFAGFAAARGDLHPVAVALAGAGGAVLGTVPWYLLARCIGPERLTAWVARHGRWLTVSAQDVDRARRRFERRGALAVFLGRLVPALRSVISAPAGFARMPWTSFLLWSSAGSLLWCGMLTAAGVFLEGRYESVARWIDPVSYAVLGAAVATYLWRVARRPRAGQ